MSADYFVPCGEAESEFSEKRSRFIGHLRRVESEAEARAYIEQMKKKYYDARHNCWCYVVHEGGVVRYGDDGEPQGTAGQPILAVLSGAELTNVCCTVTRYFGGVLLGTGGLVRAYTAAAKAALADAGIARMALWRCELLRCPYALYERVRRLLEEREAVIEATDFGADVTLRILILSDRAAEFDGALRELSAGAVVPEDAGEVFRGARIMST
jgi:uncharacterized YigZ family protein